MRTGALLLCLILATCPAFPWGLAAHRVITESAAERVPGPPADFFRRASRGLQDASLAPDTSLRAHDRTGEEARSHFIDLDAYEPFPFAGIPRRLEDAEARYGRDAVARNGTLPWRIAGVLGDLTAAMRRGDAPRVVRDAGYLSHYVGDAYQPLHLTIHHDGDGACGEGIHRAFEAGMIERALPRYRDAVRRGAATVEPVEHPLAFVLDRMREGYPLAARILEADLDAVRDMRKDGRDYWEGLDRRAGLIAERQMTSAAGTIASLWYTAWIDAGRPDLADR
ncbi:MAG: hypothetical protein HY049_16680 [Acidobacteria bacterium]|nr:hypothetical protein [Acidobacteriota bacterium]